MKEKTKKINTSINKYKNKFKKVNLNEQIYFIQIIFLLLSMLLLMSTP